MAEIGSDASTCWVPSADLRDPPSVPDPTAVVRAYASAPVAADLAAGASESREERWPTLAGILVGLTALVFLLPDLGQRAAEAFLPPDWRVEWSSAVTPPTPVRVNRAKVSAYPTKRGSPVLVVAGDARNRSDRFLQGVEVIVAVYDGGERIDERRGFVNVVLNEGQLSSIDSAETLRAAYEEAVQAHGDRGVLMAPGSERPFMVIFPYVPENAGDLRFQVSFEVPDAPVETG